MESQTSIIKMPELSDKFQALEALKSQSPEASREDSLSLLPLLAHPMTNHWPSFYAVFGQVYRFQSGKVKSTFGKPSKHPSQRGHCGSCDGFQLGADRRFTWGPKNGMRHPKSQFPDILQLEPPKTFGNRRYSR